MEETTKISEPVEVPIHLKCQISQSILVDPVLVPCCFRVFSRSSLEVIFEDRSRRICPVCFHDLSGFDLKHAPKAVAIQDAIDAFVEEHGGIVEDLVFKTDPSQIPKWKILLNRVNLKGAHLTKIGQIRVLNDNPKFKFKTLLFNVVDESGSMDGNPIRQVRFSLNRFVDSAYTAQNMLCHVVSYDNTAQSFFIDTQLVKDANYKKIDKIGRGGGTNFQSAFDKIVEIMNFMKVSPVNNLNEISNLIIVFMTDGQDITTGSARLDMVSKLSKSIKAVWDKQFTVHTIGFSSNHDFDFLQKLSKSGTQDGAYKFADPSDDNDMLSVKINSLVQVILGSDSLPVTLTNASDKSNKQHIPIISGKNGVYWVDISEIDYKDTDYKDADYKDADYKDADYKDADCKESKLGRYFTVQSRGTVDQIVEVEIDESANPETDKKLEYSWYSHQMDKIAEELFELNATIQSKTTSNNNLSNTDFSNNNLSNTNFSNNNFSNNNLSRECHLELLNNRCRALMSRLNSNTDEFKRLEKLVETLNLLRHGETVDKMKLADQITEGQYKTISTVGTKISHTNQNHIQQYTPSNFVHTNINIYKKDLWTTIYTNLIKRFSFDKKSDSKDDDENVEIIKIFTNKSNKICLDWIDSTGSDERIRQIRDSQNSNLLILMCMSGRFRIVEKLLNRKIFAPDTIESYKNDIGLSALDCSILFGYWKIYDLLTEQLGMIDTSIDREDQFRTCLSRTTVNGWRPYEKTASRLIRDKFIKINDEFIEASPPHITQWLMSRSNLDIDMNTAIIKGVYDIVEDKLSKGFSEKLDWSKFHSILSAPKIEHVQIFELLLKHKLLDPDQAYEIKNSTIDKKDGEDDDTEITWPLFVTCEKGNTQMFNLLIKYVSKESIRRQNKKGCYCLWIASCNKHIDIVSRLLSLGSDPNAVNNKGENCIVPACQKSAVSVIEFLLVAGARLDLYNKERDNPFLLCCRTGQPVILEMFLQRLNSKELDDIHKQCAQIDGFNPLLASVELDRIECIKICHKYRADLEWRTADDNKIIPGATALHLACFYDRLDSLKLLLEIGVNILATTSVGKYNLMHIAVRRGHMRIVGFLMASLDSEFREILLKQKDESGHLPSYYAQISGNEKIYQEYFCNKLMTHIEKLLNSQEDVIKDCTNTLIKYGQTLGVFEYKDFINDDLGARGMNLASMAVINGSELLVDALVKMGADFSKPDEYGMTANFWKAFINTPEQKMVTGKDIDISIEELNENKKEESNENNKQVKLMLQRIILAKHRSIQNRFLLSPPTKTPLLLDNKTGMIINTSVDLTPTLKMNDGYDQKVELSVLKTIKRSEFMEQPLLGFIDKLKTNKTLFDEKKTIEYILWDSKLHVIKLVASGEKYLEPIEIMALYLYSTCKTIFEQVNQTLTRWNNSTYSLWHPFVITLYNSILHLPIFEGEVYRCIDRTFDLDFYKIGSQISWSTFSVCSKEYSSCVDTIKNNKGMIFIVKSKSGREISRYSKTPADQDVIFLPESKFVVTNYYQANQMTLAQENIRNITFKIREKDIKNAIDGQCIIIELQEI